MTEKHDGMATASVTGGDIRAIFTETLDVEVPRDGQGGLLENGHIDSLTLVDLLMELEESYGVEFSADDLDPSHFESMEAIAELVNSRRGRP